MELTRTLAYTGLEHLDGLDPAAEAELRDRMRFAAGWVLDPQNTDDGHYQIVVSKEPYHYQTPDGRQLPHERDRYEFCWPQYGSTAQMHYYGVTLIGPDGECPSPVYRSEFSGQYEFYV